MLVLATDQSLPHHPAATAAAILHRHLHHFQLLLVMSLLASLVTPAASFSSIGGRYNAEYAMHLKETYFANLLNFVLLSFIIAALAM